MLSGLPHPSPSVDAGIRKNGENGNKVATTAISGRHDHEKQNGLSLI
jgi:hypothetical protein